MLGFLNFGKGMGGVSKTFGVPGLATTKAALSIHLLDRFEGAVRVATAAQAKAQSYGERYAHAVNMLDLYFDVLDTAAGRGKKDGKISERDLRAALRNPALPQELRDACRFLLENRGALRSLDIGAGKGWCDGIISKKDVAAVLAKLPAELRGASSDSSYGAQWENVLHLLQTYFDVLDTAAGKGKKDGKISRKDLLAALNNASLPKELREVCRFLLENQALFNQLDVAAGKGRCDGIISQKDLEAALKALQAGKSILGGTLGGITEEGTTEEKIEIIGEKIKEIIEEKIAEPTTVKTAKTGLGDAIDELAALSPSLQTDLKRLQNEGWSIEYGTSGGGSYCSKANKTITIDSSQRNNPASVVSVLSHEVGHATYTAGVDFGSKAAFVNSMLADEGAATLNNIKVQREIMANGGPKLVIPSGNSANVDAYNRSYDQYLLDGDVAKARNAIGATFAYGERTSTTGQTYYDYYASWYEQNYGR